MEDGQKALIPLDSPLDVHSSDMLVNVNSPEFQHNRQQYQGKYMPTSLRYEHDGWAAGWDVYQFEFIDAAVETTPAGFTVSKQKIYNNPMYRLAVKNAEDKEVGSVYYTPESDIKSTTCKTVSVSSGVSPNISGQINGKQFNLAFDSLNPTNRPLLTGHNDIEWYQGAGFNISDTYIADIKLQDNSLSVDMQFKGITLPTEIINTKDDGYLLGEFAAYSGGAGIWLLNKFTLTVAGDELIISADDTEDVIATVTDVFENGKYSYSQSSFTVPLKFVDTPSCTPVQFYPFFSSVTYGTQYKSVQLTAPESISFNRWLASSSDLNAPSENKNDKLYRNFTLHGAPNNNFNKQTIVQKVPVWFGIRATGNMSCDTSSAYTSDTVGRLLYETSNYYDHADVADLYSYRVVVEAKTTNQVLMYDRSLYRPDVHIFEHCFDKTDEYTGIDSVPITNVPVKIVYKTRYYDGEMGSFKYQEHSATVTLTTAYSNLDYVSDIVTFKTQRKKRNTDNDTTNYEWEDFQETVEAYKDVHITYTMPDCTCNISGKWLKTAGKVIVNNGTATITPPEIKGKIAEDSKTVYKKVLSGSIAYWSVAAYGYVASDVYLSPDVDTLTQITAEKAFIIEKHDIDNTTGYRNNNVIWLDDDTNGTNMFTHKIGMINPSDPVEVYTYLCAVSGKTYMYYGIQDASNMSSSSATAYCPGNIITGKLSDITSDGDGYVSAYLIKTRYSVNDVDANYGLSGILSCIPAKTDSDTLFNYIEPGTVEPSIDTSTLLPGNKFTDAVMPEILNSFYYSVGVWQGYFDFSGSTDELNFKNKQQLCNIHIADSASIEFKYLLNDTIPVMTQNSYTCKGYNITVSVTAFEDIEDNASVLQRLKFTHTVQQSSSSYDISFKRPWLVDAVASTYGQSANNLTLLSVKDNIVMLQDNNGFLYKINYDIKQAYVSFDGINYTEADESFDIDNSVYIRSIYHVDIIASILGVYNIDNITIDNLTSSTLTFSYNGAQYSLDISKNGLFDDTKKPFVDFYYTDTRDPEMTKKCIQRVNAEQEMQFLKQQWDTTVDTENFWWIDNKHVLVLDKHNLILRENTDELHDWNGNVFIDKHIWPRSEYLISDVRRYFCTNAYGGASARFVTVSIDMSNILFKVYDPLNNMSVKEYKLKLVKRQLGSKLNQDATVLNTYSDIIPEAFISRAIFSATIIGSRLIIGVTYDKNFNQWAVEYDIVSDTLITIIQGYGFVGINGTLTGGEIPYEYCDNTGFSDTVYSLDTLSDTEEDIQDISMLYTLDSKVVGSDAQQWYICKKITGIISHWTYNSTSDKFTAVKLPLTNNYSIRYDSGSFCSSVFSDFNFKITNLRDIVPSTNKAAWTTMLALMSYPLMYYLNPKITVGAYLQQTVGQAAYVHYNSTAIRKQKDVKDIQAKENRNHMDHINFTQESVISLSEEYKSHHDPLTSDEISFDRQSIRQEATCNNPYNSLLATCAAALVSALDLLPERLSVNNTINMVTAVDKGKQYTQNFMQNVFSMSAADLQLAAVAPTVNTEVTAIKTLDMFYSTSDTQQVFAGPGFVNHNFVAQCISQGATALNVNINQQRIMYAITSLTTYQLQISYFVIKATHDALFGEADSISQAWTTAVGSGTNYGWIAGLAMRIASTVMYIASQATKIAIDNIPIIIDCLTGGKLTSTITGRISRLNYDVEAKHKYGSRSEVFMYPCFGCDYPQSIPEEYVEVVSQNKPWKLKLPTDKPREVSRSNIKFVTQSLGSNITDDFNGDIPYYIAMSKGIKKDVSLPSGMAYVIGTESFLPSIAFRNENIGEGEPVFPTPPVQDYIIDSQWQISRTATVGMTTWLSCKDTKIIDGEPSNMVISSNFCGVASPYTAIEVKRGISKDYLRPWAVTPQALAINMTGFNCCYEEKAYHAFDGYGQRIISWLGAPGMNKQRQTLQYAFVVNNRFKRSNKVPRNEFQGNFQSDPSIAIDSLGDDWVYKSVSVPGEIDAMNAGVIGEDKDVVRYAVPVFSEYISTLPAVLKTISSYNLSVIDGITTLTSDNRDLQSAYKAPTSIDFAIGKNKFRVTDEYICQVNTDNSGVTVINEITPCLGLTFIGATPYEAYFYSQSTRQYYVFTGSNISAINTVERFDRIVNGRYDFINQEVIMPCTSTFLRLDPRVKDDSDITDNVIIPRLIDRKFIGEVYPPIDTIYNTRSWFRTLSLPSGVTFQGPNRCIINRFIYSDYMLKQIKANYGKWKRVYKEIYHPFRRYIVKYENVNEYLANDKLPEGWIHNPFLLVTAPVGIVSEVDCLFEWEVTFTWPVEMDKLYGIDNYAVVMLQAETMTPGGKVIASRPTHVYLTKELFTRTGNYGYYSFRYQSKCGIGNRERLHIWSDQYICISSLQVEYKPMTQKRTEILTQQVDIQTLKEI